MYDVNINTNINHPIYDELHRKKTNTKDRSD